MLARAAAPNERGSVKYNNCAKSDINKKLHDAIPYFKKKKNSYCESTQKNGSGKNSILQPGVVSGLRVGFGLC
jgi:hypothetical protein